MSVLRYLQTMLLVSQLTHTKEAQPTVNCQNFKFVIDEDVVYNHILEGHVFQRLTVHSATQCHWSAKMTACVYSWIISLCLKKITVSSTTLTKTWSQRRWNGVKEDIILTWWEATRWRWEIESLVVDKIVYYPTGIQLGGCYPRAEYNSMFLSYDCLRKSLNI